MKNTIFYFSGTGNSLKVAKDIAAGVENAQVISMAAAMDNISDFAPQGTVGFVFPVYYCGLPQMVRAFISRINLDRAVYVYMAATYGSVGGNAGCVTQAKKLLKDKGKRLDASFYVKSVDNFILWTWDVPPASKHAALHEGARKKAAYIAKMVSDQKEQHDKSITEFTGPILFGYNHFLKTVHFSDKAFHCSDGCTACGLCAKVCPTENIHIINGRPAWKSEKCQRCLACLHLCPAACIQYGNVTAKRHRYKNPHITMDELKRDKP